MKIIQLEILNLASLDRQGGEVINFEEGALGDSNIFSIVGPTGSGKSTLLDAICLALYGRAPRYPKKSGDRKQGIVIYGQAEDGENNRPAPTDSVNILTRGKKTGYSKLTFKANNGNVYRAEWHVRFKNKTYDKPGTYLYQLTQENGQPKEVTAEWNDLPTIIGLDYEQFLRTVLIAQGTFANFLTAKEDERFQLLEKLIGCEDLYTSIVQKIKEQKENAIEAYNEINANFAVYEKDLISDDELQTLKQRILELEEEEKKVKAEIGKIVESLGWYTAETQFLENIGKFKIALNEAQQKLETKKDEIESLKLHDTTLPAVNLYNEILQIKKNIKKYNDLLTTLNEQIKEKEETVKKETSELDTLKAKADAASRDLEEKKPHINKARIIKGELASANNVVTEKESSKKDAEDKLKLAKETVTTNNNAIQEAEKTLEEANTAYNKQKADIEKEKESKDENVKKAKEAFETEKKKAEGLDAATLQQASTMASQKKNDMTKAIDIRQSIKKTTDNLDKNNQEIQQLTERNKAIDNEISGFNIESLKTEVQTLQKAYTLMTSENWDQHRADLDEGKPCPLCGSTHHPYKSQETFAPIVTEMDHLLKEKQKALEEQEKQSETLSKEKSRNLGTIGTKNQLVETKNSELGEQQKSWKNIQAKYPSWPEDVEKLQAMKSDIDEEAEKAAQKLNDFIELNKSIAKLHGEKEEAESAQRTYKEQSDKKLEEAKNKITDANTALQTEMGKTENLKKQVEEKNQEFTKADKALTDAKAVVTEKTKALKEEIGDNDPETFEKLLQKAKGEAEKAVKKQVEKITGLENDKKVLQGQAQATEKTKNDEDKKLAKKEPELNAWINNYNAESDRQLELTIEDIIRLSESTVDWEDIRTKLNKLTTAVTQAKTTYENENKAHKEHQEKKPTEEKETLEARKAELEQKSNTELTDCKAQKKRHDEAKNAMGKIGEEIQAKRQQKDEWEEITTAIGGDGKTLRKIAQCYTLRFLIAHANVEIRKFNSRYELQQVKNSLGIRVIDHDRADDIRDTTSLSGGETFIVSLGLALGLSALSSRNISFENLFIDEGFGTLDHDTLETVINSLAMLQSSQGKKVGVISHTDTMSRITTQIRVIRNGSSGSSHIEIYP